MAAPAFQQSQDETVSIPEACRRLANMGRSTFYRIPFFRTRIIPVSGGRVGVRVSDINQYIQMQQGQPRRLRGRARGVR